MDNSIKSLWTVELEGHRGIGGLLRDANMPFACVSGAKVGLHVDDLGVDAGLIEGMSIAYFGARVLRCDHHGIIASTSGRAQAHLLVRGTIDC